MSGVAGSRALLARFGLVLEHGVLGGRVGCGTRARLLPLSSLLRRASGNPATLRGASCPLSARRGLAVDVHGPLLDIEIADQLLELFVRDLLARLLRHEHAPAPGAPALAFGLNVHRLARPRRRVGRDVAEFARDSGTAAAVGALALLPVSEHR